MRPHLQNSQHRYQVGGVLGILKGKIGIEVLTNDKITAAEQYRMFTLGMSTLALRPAQ